MDQDSLLAFKRLLAAYSCVRVVTYEEPDSLQMALNAAADLRLSPWIWTSTHGLRQAMLARRSGGAEHAQRRRGTGLAARQPARAGDARGPGPLAPP